MPAIEPDAPPVDLDRRPRAPWDLTPTAERDWFEVLPEGLVVVLEPDRSGGWSTTSGAWLHVGGDGVVTAFTGKVDGGQDNRTGLSIIVAESLGVPLGDVRLVMGDTDLCPHDAGTFGSRSTPDAGRELRVLGKAARDVFDGLARARGRKAERIGDTRRGDCARVEVASRAGQRGARSGGGRAGDGSAVVDATGGSSPHRAIDRDRGEALPIRRQPGQGCATARSCARPRPARGCDPSISARSLARA